MSPVVKAEVVPVTCPKCNGSGLDKGEKCLICAGFGRVGHCLAAVAIAVQEGRPFSHVEFDAQKDYSGC